ncbi:hypothetical protein [Nonomuraea sp. NPDC049400]|uniref:hypothetical protein n=1 Tax=Nonomuraea sp. NPDC049400 TaxID=3364352 RepID=UPI00378C4663
MAWVGDALTVAGGDQRCHSHIETYTLARWLGACGMPQDVEPARLGVIRNVAVTSS